MLLAGLCERSEVRKDAPSYLAAICSSYTHLPYMHRD